MDETMPSKHAVSRRNRKSAGLKEVHVQVGEELRSALKAEFPMEASLSARVLRAASERVGVAYEPRKRPGRPPKTRNTGGETP